MKLKVLTFVAYYLPGLQIRWTCAHHCKYGSASGR